MAGGGGCHRRVTTLPAVWHYRAQWVELSMSTARAEKRRETSDPMSP